MKMDKFKLLEKKYEEHFNVSFPQRIIGFWDPVHDTPQYIQTVGYDEMKKAIDEAITKNEPFEEIPEEEWASIRF